MLIGFIIFGVAFVVTGLFARIVNKEWAKWPILIVCAIGALYTLFLTGVGVYNVFMDK